MQPDLTKVCAHCGEMFAPRPKCAPAAWQRQRFCSRLCSIQARVRNPIIRLIEKVDQHGPVPAHRPDLGPCWLWTAGRYPEGYGIFHFEKDQPAHRVSYMLFVGKIPEGLELDHLCRVRECVNPTHLEPVTKRENIMRGQGATAQHARQTHCLRGHEFTPENTRVRISAKYGTPRRECRACLRIRRLAA